MNELDFLGVTGNVVAFVHHLLSCSLEHVKNIRISYKNVWNRIFDRILITETVNVLHILSWYHKTRQNEIVW